MVAVAHCKQQGRHFGAVLVGINKCVQRGDNVLDHAARDGDVCFIHTALVLGKAQFNRKIARIACAQRILLAEIEARRR